MDTYEALYTTRAMRRVTPDPIPLDVQQRILDAAVRAPSGGNTQNWRFLLVDDRKLIEKLAPIYARCIDQLWSTMYKERIAQAEADPQAPSSISDLKMVRSAQHLADHFGSVPLLLFAFVQGDTSGGSIFPAVWSAQLAARSGTCRIGRDEGRVAEADATCGRRRVRVQGARGAPFRAAPGRAGSAGAA